MRGAASPDTAWARQATPHTESGVAPHIQNCDESRPLHSQLRIQPLCRVNKQLLLIVSPVCQCAILYGCGARV